MKKFQKIGSLILALALAITTLVACGGGSDNSKGFTVSFETNGGSAVSSVKVEEGATATRPADPTKTDFFFSGWYTDAELSNAYDFATPVTADLKLYAAWVDAAGSVKATFYTDNTTVFTTAYFEDGGRIAKPADPTKAGCYFAGWFTEDGTQYKATAKFTGEQKFFAKWLDIYTFEAEKTQLTGLDPDEDDTCDDAGNKLGQSYSGNLSGAALICGCTCNASNDAYVTNLYYNGAYIQFEITSDKDVDDALLFLRLSAEFSTMTFTKDNLLVAVNGTQIKFADFTIQASTDDLTSTKRTSMADFAMGNISLKAGQNVIRLEVTNSDKQFETGTMAAAAPMIDCIKVYSTSTLTMKEYNN